MGFEPTRAEHIGLAVQRLNHSATSSVGWQTFQFNVVKSRLKHVLQSYVQSEETVWLYTIKSGRGAGAFQTVACNDNRTYLCLVSEYQKLHRYINDWKKGTSPIVRVVRAYVIPRGLKYRVSFNHLIASMREWNNCFIKTPLNRENWNEIKMRTSQKSYGYPYHICIA